MIQWFIIFMLYQILRSAGQIFQTCQPARLEQSKKGAVSSLIAESLEQLAALEHRTSGHFLLELLVKPSEALVALFSSRNHEQL